MEFGLMVEPQVGGSYAELRDLARWAEDQGLDAFARSDHLLNHEDSAPSTDALTTYGGLAEATDSIQLAVLVTPLTFRHPAVIVKTAATLDEMSSGRFALGVGTGWMQSEHDAFGLDLPPLAQRFDRLGETLAYLRAAFHSSGGFDGQYYRLDPIDVLPRPANLPIVIGGGGARKTPTYAGQFADEYNLFVTDRATLDDRISVMRSAALAAGRNPDAIKVSLMGPAVVAPDEASYRAMLERRGARRDQTADEYEASLEDLNVPHGTPDRAHASIEVLRSIGIHRYYVQDFRGLGSVDTSALARSFSILRS
jgi:alkanesulfonate monooxygenase SsuD/methylene tetrahydromethanopterin reductase-like flavin-dependent oxidoreductase (luciferase family)